MAGGLKQLSQAVLISALLVLPACTMQNDITETEVVDFVHGVPSGFQDILSLENISSDLDFKLDDLSGEVVYVDFWASWCAPCVYSLPFFEEVSEQYEEQGFKLLSVNVDTDQERAMALIGSLNLDHPVFHDPQGVVKEKYEIIALPTGILFDANSKPVLVHKGFAPGHDKFLKARIERELKRKAFRAKKNIN